MARAPIGLRIKERRKASGVTQAALAQKLEISASYLNLIENGKRPIGGGLLVRIARELGTDLESLDGAAERQLVGQLSEIATDPVVQGIGPQAGQSLAPNAMDLVGRHPDWARAVVALHRAFNDRDRLASALSDRLNQDPFLNEAVHRMLGQVAAIRSASEILDDADDLSPDETDRFHGMLAKESANLTNVTRSIASFFDKSEAQSLSTTPAEEVDAFIEAKRNYFETLETGAEALRAEIGIRRGLTESRLVEHLKARFDVDVAFSESPIVDEGGFLRRMRFDRDAGCLFIASEAAGAARRFRIARLACELNMSDAIQTQIKLAPGLKSDPSRVRAMRALASYAAAALLMPYQAFLEDAKSLRYDLQLLARRYAVSFEQAAHRLTSLRRPSAEGVPFGFMRVDPSGFVGKRLALPDLPLPRYGGACPLWAIYRAAQRPGEILRQLVEFPAGGRFLFIARAQERGSGSYDRTRHTISIMLACDAIHAEQLVYGDGLAVAARAAPEFVGQSCRLCARSGCPARQEELLVG
ncbi:MAG: short-chain fatty acyl-CoA regulator family protein [Pseudomonadota bacterium]